MVRAAATQERDRRLIATLLLGTSSDPEADGQFYAHTLLFDTLSQGLWRDKVANHLAELVEAQWRRLAASPALLRMPRLSVPKILEACDSSKLGHRKSARILLAASDAVSLDLPADIRRRMELWQ